MEACAAPPQSLEHVPPLYDFCQSSDHDTNSCAHEIFMVSKLDREVKNYREFMENMTCRLIDQFSKLVKSHAENTMRVLHETKLRVGPTIPEGCLLDNFESPYPFSP